MPQVLATFSLQQQRTTPIKCNTPYNQTAWSIKTFKCTVRNLSTSDRRPGQRRRARGPQHLSKLSKRRLKDDTRVLGTVHICHSLFVHVNLEAYQGSSVTQHKHTVQSQLGSVRAWFMTDQVGAGWRDLSPAQACKSGLFSRINNCEIHGGENILSLNLFALFEFTCTRVFA